MNRKTRSELDLSKEAIVVDLETMLINELCDKYHHKRKVLLEYLDLLNIEHADHDSKIKSNRKEKRKIELAQSYIDTIGADRIRSYYENHSHGASADHFNMSVNTFLKIMDILNIEQHTAEVDRQLHKQNIEQGCIEKYGEKNVSLVPEVVTKIKKSLASRSEEEKRATVQQIQVTKTVRYGDPYYNNRPAAEETCETLYGSKTFWGSKAGIESTKNSRAKQKISKFENIDKSFVEEYYRTNSTHSLALILHMHTDKVIEYLTWADIPIHSKEEDISMMMASIESKCIDKYGKPAWALGIESQKENGICRGKPSKYETHFKELLEENNISIDTTEYYLDKKYYDFKIGDTLVELNPSATHNINWSPFSETPIQKCYHKDKTDIANENGFRCIHVWDWDNETAILNLLKISKHIGARKCTIKTVSKKDSKLFLEEYHVQGDAKSSVRIGLYINDELVSLMTFGKPRYNKNVEWELVRYCSKLKITGGAKKLFQYFLDNYTPRSVVSYCDLSKFNGSTYDSLGFKLLAISEPRRHWYNIKSRTHITDNLLMQRGYDQLFGTSFGKGSSNEELMLATNFIEIYDCGQATYIFERGER